jgi:acetolactate synthase regulatory subunit
MSMLTLRLRVRNEEGALVRILGMTRRRRFNLLSLVADCSADQAFLEVRMTVEAERSAPAFVRQIEKLEDVARVEVVAPGQAESDIRTASAC